MFEEDCLAVIEASDPVLPVSSHLSGEALHLKHFASVKEVEFLFQSSVALVGKSLERG
jgi:hypothetical protein